ncbi:MAG TPA: UDP-N-acetylmuramate--L-alanine ligase [Syntrophales bacterium]|nr:UDP-N-acetylmuramate--L-alanine ligase [Syntrophales bacterium]HOD98454.1 UDP-N-acetylmuramate--L-alanine ligase [Syntrophales bacterium]HPN08697.1 UDP-N-acetylmuramate--L-alanine ligase [Syntrophales bacterium]HPX81750.1 UDP-N-acetylmuramate--L-alanine ligase [Syntrophales bacterium]HQB14014.1 UDP-N-acetylmuramate--L-alanine ligase [Syntrophales bacterium]
MTDTRRMDGMRRKVKTVHFVGIGGIGMSGIAEVLLNLGYGITGSDLGQTDITQRLATLGAVIFKGHDEIHLGDADVVVTSTAVKSDNPEVLAAHRRNIPVIPRAEMLAELLKMKFSIAVSGSHGKTTTTSMISTVLGQGGLDPTMVIGGKLASIGSNAKMGGGEIIVAEADESDGSFLKLGPCIAVITNIDREHLDHYRDIDEIKAAFLQFANIVPFYGSTVLCLDNLHIREILPQIKRKTITYGLEPPADYRAADINIRGTWTSFNVLYREELLGAAVLNVPGLFNVYNALATIAVAREIDMDFPAITAGLKTFTGVQRRLEVKGIGGGVTVVDDYGHHPTEIRETLAAARTVWPGRLLVVFQPHRYTRTRALFEEFTGAFSDADLLVITDIYAASEAPIPGVNSENLAAAIRKQEQQEVMYIADFDAISDRLLALARPGDVIITQGAGSVWKIGEEYLQKAAAKR